MEKTTKNKADVFVTSALYNTTLIKIMFINERNAVIVRL